MNFKGKNYPKIIVKKAYLVSYSLYKKTLRKANTFWQQIDQLPTRFNVDINFAKNPNTILLVSSGRSGSTWIANLINHANEYRFVFEPFHPGTCSYMKAFPKWIYLPEDKDFSSTQFDILNKVMRGQVQSKWVNKFNHRLFTHQRLIKSIRAHFVLYWLWKQFQIPIIFLMRHPLAVANSVLVYNETDPSWNADLEPFMANPDLMSQLTPRQQKEVKSANTLFKKQLLQWSFTNAFALRQLENIPHHLMFYEHVHRNPILEMKKTCHFLGKAFGRRRNNLIEKKTHIRYIDIDKSKKSSLDKWRTYFSKEEKQQAQKYLQLFELDHIYSVEHTLPLVNITETIK